MLTSTRQLDPWRASDLKALGDFAWRARHGFSSPGGFVPRRMAGNRAAKFGRFIPCVRRAWLLQTGAEAAKGAGLDFPVVRAFGASIFGRLNFNQHTGQEVCAVLKSISRGAPVGGHNINDSFAMPQCRRIRIAKDKKLPRCSVRENTGAAKFNPFLKSKGREPRQPNE